MTTNWINLIDGYGKAVLFHLGLDSWDLESRVQSDQENILVRLLREEPNSFLSALTDAGNGTVNIVGICRLVVLTQMILYDQIGGPERDYKQKALRRHWYAYFKQFSQLLAFLLDKVDFDASGKKVMNDIQWSGRLSQVYAGFVDSGECTYQDLWVKDASRMVELLGWDNQLIDDLNIFVAVEKDSLFEDFKGAAGALGSVAFISGKGKNSKAATELMLRNLNWGDSWAETSLESGTNVVLHVSDHDYDGQGVIGPTFAEQMRRYIPVRHEGRIGVVPEHVAEVVDDKWEASYQIKVNNKGYRDWADQFALFWGQCADCQHEQIVIGVYSNVYKHDEWIPTNDRCTQCRGIIVVSREDYERPHGYEVEALRSADYYERMVDVLLQHVDWWTILGGLRDKTMTKLDTFSIAYNLQDQLAEKIEEYKKISDALEVLQNARNTLRDKAFNIIQKAAKDIIEGRYAELREMGDDPDVEDFKDHVDRGGRNGSGMAWMPYSVYDRAMQVREWLEEDDRLEDEILDLSIENYEEIVQDVMAALE